MEGRVENFFSSLTGRGRIPTLGRASGTIRFELVGDAATESWLIDIDRGSVRTSRGDVGASRGDAAGDCVVRMDRAVFDGITSGELNAMAAMLRGDLFVAGDPELLVLVQRLFPGPHRSEPAAPAAPAAPAEVAS